MGYGYSYKCRCGNEYYINFGHGFLIDFEDTSAKAREGIYGAELQQLLNDNDRLFIKDDEKVFICKCGNWKKEKDLTVYEHVYYMIDPKDLDEIKDEKLKEKIIDRVNKPYGERIYKRYAPICAKCKNEMEALSEDEVEILACPKCGRKNKIAEKFLWD